MCYRYDISAEERHLQTVIRMTEDNLLRTKNTKEQARISRDLKNLRLDLQQMEWKRMGRY